MKLKNLRGRIQLINVSGPCLSRLVFTLALDSDTHSQESLEPFIQFFLVFFVEFEVVFNGLTALALLNNGHT